MFCERQSKNRCEFCQSLLRWLDILIFAGFVDRDSDCLNRFDRGNRIKVLFDFVQESLPQAPKRRPVHPVRTPAR